MARQSAISKRVKQYDFDHSLISLKVHINLPSICVVVWENPSEVASVNIEISGSYQNIPNK